MTTPTIQITNDKEVQKILSFFKEEYQMQGEETEIIKTIIFQAYRTKQIEKEEETKFKILKKEIEKGIKSLDNGNVIDGASFFEEVKANKSKKSFDDFSKKWAGFFKTSDKRDWKDIKLEYLEEKYQ